MVDGTVTHLYFRLVRDDREYLKHEREPLPFVL
jgi:hypothetical protein